MNDPSSLNIAEDTGGAGQKLKHDSVGDFVGTNVGDEGADVG